MTSEDKQAGIKMLDAVRARINQHGELHLDSHFTALLLSWLRITEQENVALSAHMKELQLLLRPLLDERLPRD